MEFQVYEILAKLAIEHKLDITREDDIKRLLSLFETRIEGLSKRPTFVYGKRSENAFFELVKALDSTNLIKEEDTGRTGTNLSIKIPDYKIVTKDDEIFFVEVKNFAVKPSTKNIKKHSVYALTQNYWRSLNAYSHLVKTSTKIAIFWKSWGTWTLNNLEDFKSSGIHRKITFPEAVKSNQMVTLGDKSIWTASPLAFRLIMEPKPIDTTRSQTSIVSKIIGVEMCSQGTIIHDKEIANLAYMLFWFGQWEQAGPFPILKDDLFHGIEFTAKPFEETEGQGFEMIATLSGMYMNMYHLMTHKGEELPEVFPRQQLPPISKILPENPIHRGLPLLIMTQKPSSI
jgi:hypothetical protein